MLDTVGQRVHRYLLDGSDEDIKRLLAISRTDEPIDRDRAAPIRRPAWLGGDRLWLRPPRRGT
jgi:hypothetical protein